MIEIDASRILGGMVEAGGVVAAGTKQTGVKVLPQDRRGSATPVAAVQVAATTVPTPVVPTPAIAAIPAVPPARPA